MVTVAVGSRYSIDRAGLAALVGSLPGLSLVAQDSSPPPQVLVWDTGGEGLERLPPLPLETALLLLVQDEVPKAPPPEVAGLFSKDEAPEALGVAIRQVARGEVYLSTSLALALVQRNTEKIGKPAVEINTLTEREREVLALLAEGLSNKAIAARLYLSVRTVEGHLASLYTRLSVHSRTEAMRVALQLGDTIR